MTVKEWKQKYPELVKARKEKLRMDKEKRMAEENPHYEPPYWPVVISGFPGVGKTYAAEHSEEWGMKIVEIEPSQYLWTPGEDGKLQKNTNYPENLCAEVMRYLKAGQSVDVILVDAHTAIQKALHRNHIPFVSVYPKLECKEEYLRRYIRSGKPFPFVDTISGSWNELIEDGKTRAKNGQSTIFLGSDSYLDEDTIINIRIPYGEMRAAAMIARKQL